MDFNTLQPRRYNRIVEAETIPLRAFDGISAVPSRTAIQIPKRRTAYSSLESLRAGRMATAMLCVGFRIALSISISSPHPEFQPGWDELAVIGSYGGNIVAVRQPRPLNEFRHLLTFQSFQVLSWL